MITTFLETSASASIDLNLLFLDGLSAFHDFLGEKRVTKSPSRGSLTVDKKSVRLEDEKRVKALVESLERGLTTHPPELIDEGEGGSYKMYDGKGTLSCIFKPKEEEAASVENPKGSQPLIQSIKPGEGAIREVAAYLLDSGNFSGVPLTVMVECQNAQVFHGRSRSGSLQEYVEHDFDSSEISPSKYPVKEVHKIGILDIRLFNLDRHAGNILVRMKKNEDKGTRSKTGEEFVLIPIDHGYSLPPYPLFDDGCYFEWLYWPQAKKPFDEETKRYILEHIDLEQDVKMLRRLGLSEESLKTLRITTLFLKKGCEEGWTLFDIANFICRPDVDQKSSLELLCQEVEESISKQNESEKNYFAFFSSLLDERMKDSRGG